ncbi:MAG: hypothetical protein H0T76_04620 [Nannocystis sp.]|nr:hypothetical protein [Nannocystis sp.]MBA3545747.1 hypothetical protein [Nannocystis sp.]
MNHTPRAARISALLLTITAGCAKPLVSLTDYDSAEDSDPELVTAGNSTGGIGTDGVSTGGPAPDSSSGSQTRGTEDTGVNEAPTTGTGEPFESHEDCNADTWMDVPGEQPPYNEVVKANWDVDALTPIACKPTPSIDCHSSGPIPGLQTALVVRNDQILTQRAFVPDNARWFVWSNVELGCADPFGVPLCKDQWRVSWGQSAESFCEITMFEGNGIGFGIGWDVSPIILEVGDADCNVESFTFAEGDDYQGEINFQVPKPTPPWGTPLVGSSCITCALPGGLELLSGDFVTTICQ